MWKFVLLIVSLALSAPALGQSISVFGNSTAQQCYLETKLNYAASTALQTCNQALREVGLSKRDKAKTLVNRGINYNHLGDYDQAHADFDAAQALIQNLPEAHLNRGNTFLLQKQFDASIAEYDQAIEMNIDDLFAAHFNRGLALEAQKRFEDAYAAFQASAADNPNFSHAQDRLRIYKGKFDFAK